MLEFHGKAITIACTDQVRSERFYQGVLGAQRLPGDGYGCSWFRLGSLTLSLMPNATESSPAEFPTHAMPILWLEVDDLAAAAELFARSDVVVVEPGDGQSMLVADPDGLIIEVWQSQANLECVGLTTWLGSDPGRNPSRKAYAGLPTCPTLRGLCH